VSIADGVRSGRLVNLDAVLWVRESDITSGPATGTRAIDVRPWGGIGCRIYPDRGLDIGQAWFDGVPLAWVSQVGETGPLSRLEGVDWIDGFGGGLMVTCGLRNVGMPSEGHGLHGTFSHLAASDVSVGRVTDGDGPHVVVGGTVLDAEPPAPLRVERTIRVFAGEGRIDLTDTATNLGDEPVPAPLLYHCNFGFPLWAPPARLEIPAIGTVPRDPASAIALGSWHLPPDVEEAPERVLEHLLEPDLEWGWARLTNPELGVAVTLGWDRAHLPALSQWLDPNPGMAVLGVEPANCSTRGRGADRAEGRLPVMEPGGVRITRLRIEARRT
jgi:hypothetical protein